MKTKSIPMATTMVAIAGITPLYAQDMDVLGVGFAFDPQAWEEGLTMG